MRERNTRNSRRNDDGVALWARPLIWSGGMLLSRPRDSMLTIAATVAAGAIIINSLYLQPGPHPAPIFAFKHSPIAADTPVGAIADRMPASRPVEAAKVEPAPPPRAPAPAVPQPAPRPRDPIAELLTSAPPPSRSASTAPVPPAPIPQTQPAGSQLLAVQRRLSEYGYGPVPLNGVDGPETRAAIERFERSRGLPATGKMSDKLVRELTSMAGKPL